MVSIAEMSTSATAASEPVAVPGMLDLILRGQARLSAVLTVDHNLPGAIKKLLALSVAGLFAHGIVAGAAAELFVARGAASFGVFTTGHPLLWMPPTFAAAFIGALSICLPSFYFYTQIAGLDASFRLVTAQALRAQATTSVLLFGALPIYVAA